MYDHAAANCLTALSLQKALYSSEYEAKRTWCPAGEYELTTTSPPPGFRDGWNDEVIRQERKLTPEESERTNQGIEAWGVYHNCHKLST